MNGSTQESRWSGVRIAAILVLAYGLATFALTSRVGSTLDEPQYINAGRVVWQTGEWGNDYARLQGPIPILANQLVGRGRDAVSLPSISDPTLVRARWGMLPFGLLCAVFVFLWARQLFGSSGGLAALALFVTNPLMLGYGSLVAVDMAHAAFVVLAWWMAWLCLRKPTLLRIAAVGIGLGLAFATKYLAILHGPPIVLMIATRVYSTQRERMARTGPALALAATAALAVSLIAVASLHGCYGFRAGFAPTLAASYHSDFIARCVETPVLSQVIGAFPDPFIRGIDFQYNVSRGDWTSFSNGRFDLGHPEYYLLAFLVKSPELLLLLTLWLLFYGAPRMLLGRLGPARRDAARVLTAAILIPLIYLSFFTQQRLGVRYALPAFPLLFVWLGGILNQSTLAALGRGARRATAACAAAAVGALALSSAAQWPNLLAYYNPSSGGPEAGRQYFSCANSDWGQMRLNGVQLLNDPEHRPASLTAHIGSEPVSELPRDAGPRFGLSAVYLRNLLRVDAEAPQRAYHWTDVFEPIAHLDAAWWVFDTRVEAYERAIASSGDDRHRAELAQALLATGDLVRARCHIDQLSPERAEPLHRIAGQIERAHPSAGPSSETVMTLASSWMKIGRADLALELLERDDVQESLGPLHSIARAQALRALDRMEQAVDVLERDGDLAQVPGGLVLLAQLYIRTRHPEKAVALCEQHAELLERTFGDAATQRLESLRHYASEWVIGMDAAMSEDEREP